MQDEMYLVEDHRIANPIEKTADFLLEILIAANAGKVEQALRAAAEESEEQEDKVECAVQLNEKKPR